MGVKITVEQETLLNLLGSFSGVDTDPDYTNGTLNPKGPGGPVMYTQALTRQFIAAVIGAIQTNFVAENRDVGHSLEKSVLEFADDYCGNTLPRRFPQLPWPPPPPIRPDTWPIVQLTAAIEFYNAAQSTRDTSVGGFFSDAAGKLLTTALAE